MFFYRQADVTRIATEAGLHNIRIVREIAQLPVLGTGKTDYRTLARLLTPGAAP